MFALQRDTNIEIDYAPQQKTRFKVVGKFSEFIVLSVSGIRRNAKVRSLSALAYLTSLASLSQFLTQLSTLT